jgi:hypothetical protein
VREQIDDFNPRFEVKIFSAVVASDWGFFDSVRLSPHSAQNDSFEVQLLVVPFVFETG